MRLLALVFATVLSFSMSAVADDHTDTKTGKFTIKYKPGIGKFLRQHPQAVTELNINNYVYGNKWMKVEHIVVDTTQTTSEMGVDCEYSAIIAFSYPGGFSEEGVARSTVSIEKSTQDQECPTAYDYR